jgi:putative lipoic acid-binding regulatory protein
MKYTEEEKKFKELLDNEYEWPAKYPFKFIVPSGSEAEVKSLFGGKAEIKEKSSSGGKYTSTTIYDMMTDADSILAVYRSAAKIEGIISL